MRRQLLKILESDPELAGVRQAPPRSPVRRELPAGSLAHRTEREGDADGTGELHVLAVDPGDAGTVYSVETEGDQIVLFRSGDRGGTWRRIGPIPGPPQGRVTALVADTKHPDVLWAATDLNVLRSEDGGRSWTPFNAGLARPGLTSLYRLVSDPAVPGRLYGMPVGGGLFELTTP